jgi:hypothetical protein
MFYEDIYKKLPPSVTKNRYMLLPVAATSREVNDQRMFPAYFDDLTYTPVGVEFKVKYERSGKEESYCILVPLDECRGFLFTKNEQSEDAKRGIRFDRLN